MNAQHRRTCCPSMKHYLAALILVAALVPRPGFGQGPTPNASTQRQPAVRPEDRVDLNHATLEQLLKVPGMTRTWAERIIRFRPYRSKQDLIEQGILPGEVYSRIRDYVIAHRDKN